MEEDEDEEQDSFQEYVDSGEWKEYFPDSDVTG